MKEARASEGRMIIKELASQFGHIYTEWKKNNKNKNISLDTPLAAYNAGFILSEKYLEDNKDADKNGITAINMYSIMKTKE